MAHQSSHRRILAAPHHQPTPMDPTPKRHPKPSPLTFTTTGGGGVGKHHPIHPLPDPTPPSTIQAISHHFSKLCTHHKKLLPNSLKPHPNTNPNLILDSCTTALTKSSSQRERTSTTFNLGLAKTKVKEKDDNIKKPSFNPKRSSLQEFDVKKSSQLMSKSLDGERMEIRGRVSLSSSSIPPPVNGGGGRRRSFCSSQVELADFLSSSGVKIVAVDMPPFMQIHAVDCARKAHDSLEKFTSKTLAFTLKKEFDGVYGPAWHCIVGTSFGSFVTHSVGGFIYFSMDHKLYVLLFKTTVQRAE